MDDHTLEKLQFDDIRELIAGHCSCALGKKLAHSMRPATESRTVTLWLSQVGELMAAAEQSSLPPLGGVHDIGEQVRASAFPPPLEPEALAEVADTLGATAELCGWFLRMADTIPTLRRLGDRIGDLSPIAVAIREVIDARGQIRDYASDKLLQIRRTIESTRRRIRTALERLLRQSSLTRMLQYGGITFHNDRMVLPLKAEYRGRIEGIIHRTSDTGATLFVEPAESVELNNAIIRLRDEESKEMTRILRGLTQRVHLNADAILSTLSAIAILDLIAAKCRYARKRGCTCPTIDTGGVLDLHDARHPLLLEVFAQEAGADEPPREVIPNDIRLGDDFDVLVVTGPNTGGKTVVLKTVGMLSLMTQCGIPIPADATSRMPVYRSILIDIGDEQSLQQSLSTFSSHLSHQLAILQRAGPRSLVLMDELGAGTDPDEGAAIGRAVLNELLRLKAQAIVTTHLSALKAVAYTTGRVDNASVEFDPQSLKPTFRLRIGEPGNSNALIIAKRLGMPARLIQQAGEYLAHSARALNLAIAGTQASRRQAEQARRDAREATLEADRQRQRYEKEQQVLLAEQEAFQRWTLWINNLEAGDEVYIRSLKRSARVVRMQLHKQNALVTTGTMDLEVPLRDIETPPAQT